MKEFKFDRLSHWLHVFLRWDNENKTVFVCRKGKFKISVKHLFSIHTLQNLAHKNVDRHKLCKIYKVLNKKLVLLRFSNEGSILIIKS